MEKKKAFSLKQANFTYLFLIGSFLSISAGSVVLILLGDFYLKYVVEFSMALQLIAYFPLIVYAFNSNTDIKSVLRIKGLNFKKIALTVLLVIIGYILATFVSMIWNMLMQLLRIPLQEPESMRLLLNKPVWFVVLILCVYAPVFEEFIFRGMMLSGYSAYMGVGKAAVITGVLFGMTHGFLPSVAPTGFIGVIAALIVLYTGSIFAGVVYHALHNLLAYTGLMDQYFIKLPWKLNLVPPVETLQGAVMHFVWILCWAGVATIALFFVLRSLKKDYVPVVEERLVPEDKRHRLLFWFGLAAAAVYIAVSTLAATIDLSGLPS